jgi:MFS transporter, DHA1 family, tetracycline resistance protein
MPDLSPPSQQPEAAAPDAAPPAASPSSKSAMAIVFLVVFIDLLGFGIVLPLLPLYAKDMLIPLLPGPEHRLLRGAALGGLMSVFSLMQFIFAPIWGRVSDRNGRRPILLLGLGGSVVFYALFGLASEAADAGRPALGLVLLLLARVGAGIAGATISTAQAVIADCTTRENRSRGMALIGFAFGIGFTFGPLLSFTSLFLPWKGAPGFAASLLSLVALLLALGLLPETLPAGGVARERHWLDWRGVRLVLHTPALGVLVLTFFLATLAFGGLESTLALVNVMLLNPAAVVSREAAEEAIITPDVMQKSLLVFAYVGFVLMLTQGLLYRRLVRRVGEVPFLRIGLALMALGLLGAVGILVVWLQWGSGTGVLLAALGVMTVAVIGFACLTPSVQALISRRSDPTIQGEVLGVNQSASALARILGPAVGVSLFFATDSHVLPYLLGASLLVVVFLMSLRLRPEAEPACSAAEGEAAEGESLAH